MKKIDLSTPFFAMVIIWFFFVHKEVKEIPKVNVIFENQNTICFSDEEVGTFCVDKTFKDTWDHR